MEPVRFERKGGTTKPKGCIVYLVLIPALTFFLWFVAVAILIPIFDLFHAPEPVRNGINVYFFFMILITVIKVSLADFRRRGAAVTVWPDRIQIEGRRDHGTFPFPSIRSVGLKPHLADSAVLLHPRQGRPGRLPPALAPYSKVREAFEAALIPQLQQRLDEQIQSGQPVRLSESRTAALLQCPLALLMIPVGLVCVASLFHLGLGLVLLVAVPRRIRRGWRGLQGGLEIRSGGIASTSGVVRTTIPWENLSVAKLDADGLVLRSRRGETLTLSPYAEDFWPGSRWIANRISRPAP